MAIEDYRVPFHPLDISQGTANLLTAFRNRALADQANEELRLRGEKLKNDERRLNAEEYRRQREFEQGEREKTKQAYLSAIEFDKKGDSSTADTLRRMYGIQTKAEMSAPGVFTPAMALAEAARRESADTTRKPTGDPVKFDPSEPRAPVTPMNALARRGEHTGITVDEPPPDQTVPVIPRQEMQPTGRVPGTGMEGFGDAERQRAADNLNTVGTGLHGPRGTLIENLDGPQVAADMVEQTPTGRAVQDLIPMTEDPRPTGVKIFTGPQGGEIGRFDPSEERRFREERAGRVGEALGPLGEQYVRIAGLIARGDIPEAEGKVLMTTLAAEAAAKAKADAKVIAREDEQEHRALLAKLYRNEALTKEDIYNLARMRFSAMVSASGAGPLTPQEAKLVEMREGGAGLGEVTAQAAASGPAVSMKKVGPLLKDVVTSAAAGERAGEKRAGLEVVNWDGTVMGTAHNVTQANTMKKQTDQYAQARVRLQELIDDIKKDGSRVNPLSVQDIQDRLSKAESVNAAMRVYNGLGATDASQALEARITGAIGTPGHGWLMGANLGVIERILHEADMQHKARISTTLRSNPRPLAPVLGGPRGQGTGGTPEGASWMPIPRRVADRFPGKKEILVDARGKVLESR